jgi:hypothetical protein
LEDHKPIRTAFAEVRNKKAAKITPIEIKSVSQTKNSTLVGMAFDYLLRISLKKKLTAINVRVHEDDWIANQSVLRLGLQAGGSVTKKWERVLKNAQNDAQFKNIEPSTLPDFVEHVQNLANLDYITRYPLGFDPNFIPQADVSRDLMSLYQTFLDAQGFDAQDLCILNPSFPAGRTCGGADGDLILDATLIDVKTTSTMKLSVDMALQLVSYVVLDKRSGVSGEPPNRLPLTHVGVYFARYGKVVNWQVSNLFDEGGFEKFEERFWEELPTKTSALCNMGSTRTSFIGPLARRAPIKRTDRRATLKARPGG